MRQIQPTIVVIGFMGAGKTSVGRLVARALGREFIDTDLMIERATRMTISELFQREGELSFRRREMAAIDRAISVPGRVIAVGGGAVLSAENRELMRAHGTVVYLRARIEALWERTRHDASRPLLATPDPRATLEQILERRDPLYREAAHLVVDTGSQSAATLVARVVTALRQESAGPRP